MIDLIIESSNSDIDCRDIIKWTENAIDKELNSNNWVCELIIVDSKKIQEYNRKFRKKNKSTDILSFPLWKNKNEMKKSNELLNIGSIMINQDYLNTGDNLDHTLKLIKHSIDHLMGRHHS